MIVERHVVRLLLQLMESREHMSRVSAHLDRADQAGTADAAAGLAMHAASVRQTFLEPAFATFDRAALLEAVDALLESVPALTLRYQELEQVAAAAAADPAQEPALRAKMAEIKAALPAEKSVRGVAPGVERTP